MTPSRPMQVYLAALDAACDNVRASSVVLRTVLSTVLGTTAGCVAAHRDLLALADATRTFLEALDCAEALARLDYARSLDPEARARVLACRRYLDASARTTLELVAQTDAALRQAVMMEAVGEA